jgi:hypothetical protein
MKRTLQSITGLALCLAVLLPSQTAGAGDESAREQVETLFRLTQMEEKVQASVDSVVQMELRRNPHLQGQRETLESFLQKYIGWQALKEDIAGMYLRTFSAQELKEMNAFYITPTGQKVINVVPQLVQQRNELAMQRLQGHIDELKQLIATEPDR